LDLPTEIRILVPQPQKIKGLGTAPRPFFFAQEAYRKHAKPPEGVNASSSFRKSTVTTATEGPTARQAFVTEPRVSEDWRGDWIVADLLDSLPAPQTCCSRCKDGIPDLPGQLDGLARLVQVRLRSVP